MSVFFVKQFIKAKTMSNFSIHNHNFLQATNIETDLDFQNIIIKHNLAAARPVVQSPPSLNHKM